MCGTRTSSPANHMDGRTCVLLGELKDVEDQYRRDALCDEIITRTLPVADRIAKRCGEVGRRIGISQMQVSRVEARILQGFRAALAA